MDKILKHGSEIHTIKGETLIVLEKLDNILERLNVKEETFMVLEKLEEILQRLNAIEDDLRVLKEIKDLKDKQEEGPIPEFFIEK